MKIPRRKFVARQAKRYLLELINIKQKEGKVLRKKRAWLKAVFVENGNVSYYNTIEWLNKEIGLKETS